MPQTYGVKSQTRTWSYANGWQAEQVFCLPFLGGFSISGTSNVDGTYTGVDNFITSNYAVFFPGSDLLQVTHIKDEPWMEHDVVLSDGMSQSRKVTFSYSIVYLDVPWPDNINQPDFAAGTTLKLRTRYAAQHILLPPSAITPASGPNAGPGSRPTLLCCLTDYEITWDRVQDLGDLDFNDLIGRVNDSDFFTAGDAGTILCEGAPQENSTILNPADPIAWKTVVSLKQKQIIVAGGANAGTYSWNDWYNPKTQQWEALTLSNGEPPYDSADFSGMFS